LPAAFPLVSGFAKYDLASDVAETTRICFRLDRTSCVGGGGNGCVAWAGSVAQPAFKYAAKAKAAQLKTNRTPPRSRALNIVSPLGFVRRS
jgi:hypothetical protein